MRLNEYASTRRTLGSYKIPTSVQKSIPIDEIYADGTWRSGEVYSQMWSVSDINYAMQSDDKKQDILAKMGRIYSNIPTDCWAQLCIVSQRMDEISFERDVLYHRANDGLDAYRVERNRLMKAYAKEIGNVKQQKYLILSTNKQNSKDARERLNQVQRNMLGELSNIGCKVCALDNNARLEVLHNFFRIGEETHFQFDFDNCTRLGQDFRDAIAPDAMRFCKDHIEINDSYAKCMTIAQYPQQLDDKFIATLLQQVPYIVLSIAIQPVETEDAYREIEDSRMKTDAEKVRFNRKTVENLDFVATVPYKTQAQEKNIEYIRTEMAEHDVTFAWDNELNDVVMATSIAKVDGAASSQSFEVVRSKDANADFTEQQTLKFYNDREKAKVGVYKVDRETGKYLAGAVFNLYAADDIYSVDGKLLFAAGELVATSPETGADGYTYFDCDIPIRGEYYGSSIRKDATTNSGNYIVKELRAPLGYYVNEEPMEVTFTYDGQAIMVLDNTCANKPTEMWVSKRDLTNDEELPGATLAIKDMDGNTVTTWVSTDEPHRVTGLHFGESYTLTEIRAADGYALANDITFRLIQKSDEDGNHLEECEVYYLTTKNILFWKWDDWKLLDDATVIMQDDITKVQISKKDLTTKEELPGAELVIKDKDGTEIERWISTNEPHYVEKMPAGDYTLTEITAPNGYKVAESIDFTVLPTGEIQTVVMKDAREDTPTPTPDNTPTPDHTPQPTPNTTPAPTPVPAAPTATPAPQPIIPKTGDNSPLGLLLAIAGISLAGLAVLVYKSARRKDIAPRDDDDEDTED